MNTILSDLYYNTKTGYKEIDKLYRAAKLKNANITKQAVQKWLSQQPTYTMHKPARKKYSRNRVLVSSIDEQWQADLVDLQSLENHNDGYKHYSRVSTCFPNLRGQYI